MEPRDEKFADPKVEKVIQDWRATLRANGVPGEQIRSGRTTVLALVVSALLLACAVVLVFHYKGELQEEVAAHQRDLVSFGDSLVTLGEVNQAIAVYEQACLLRPDDAHAVFKLGLALRQAGRQR